MSESSSGKRSWLKRIRFFLISFAISIAAGWVIERITDAETLAAAKRAQDEWISAAAASSPFSVATTFWSHLQRAFMGPEDDYGFSTGEGAGLASPIIALGMTIGDVNESSGFIGWLQLGLGALCIGLFNLDRTRGLSVFFDDGLTNFIFGPALIVLTASVIGLVFWLLMLGALYALSWITGLAAAAAGATGIVGFGWYCLTKLGEKGVEHVATPKI